MNEKGFSLIELLIVVIVIGVLSLALGNSFQGNVGAKRMESEVKEMQADLQNARARAIQRNRMHFVQLGATNYQIFEDTNQSGGQDGADTPFFPGGPKPLSTPITVVGGPPIINTRGIVTGPATIQFTQTWTADSNLDYDCLQLTPTRIYIGQWNGGCNAK